VFAAVWDGFTSPVRPGHLIYNPTRVSQRSKSMTESATAWLVHANNPYHGWKPQHVEEWLYSRGMWELAGWGRSPSFVWDPAQSSLALVTENQRIKEKLVFGEAPAPFKETVHPQMTIVIMYTQCTFIHENLTCRNIYIYFLIYLLTHPCIHIFYIYTCLFTYSPTHVYIFFIYRHTCIKWLKCNQKNHQYFNWCKHKSIHFIHF